MTNESTILELLLAHLNGCSEIPDLSGANLRGANLSGANLRGANLSGANLRGADLSWANLRGANLHRACLSGADLSWANLSRADLSGADLSKTTFCGAIVDGALLRPEDIGGPGWILYALTDEEDKAVKKMRGEK